MPKVFGIGFSRTGTTSLTEALTILGYDCVQMPFTMEEIDRHDASTDVSVAWRFEELDRTYPGSKFILTVRDIPSWLRSCEFHYTKRNRLEYIPEEMRDFIVDARRRAYGSEFFDPVVFEKAYHHHVERVSHYFKGRPRDLLVLSVCSGEGWEKLCSFLGRPVPDSPFPHLYYTGYPGENQSK